MTQHESAHRERAAERVDTLVDHARRAEPAPLSRARQQALVRNALSAARTDTRRERFWDVRALRIAAFTSLSTAAVVGAAFLLVARTADDPTAPMATNEAGGTQMTLPGGDRVTATSDARWTLQSAEPVARRVAVERGTVLFDVQPLLAGESFEVRADDVRVAVRGTVFSVERAEGAVTVRVYEGRVEVFEQQSSTYVGANQMWRSGAAAATPIEAAPLEVVGRSAAEERLEATRVRGQTVASAPVGPAPADVPEVAEASLEDTEGPEDSGAEEAVVEAPVALLATGSARAGTPDPGAAPARGQREHATDTHAPSSAGASAAANASAPQRPRPSVSDARAWLAAGDAQRALAAATDPLRLDPGAPRWQLTRADALRALGRHEAAADAYDRAARAGIEPGESGYTAARIRFGSLGDAAGALRSLDAAGVENGPLAERALGLRARALVRLGRTTEARAAAQRYLSRYPAGGLAPFMREQLEASE
ncbi:MAG: FecR domain-containing protein [Polyangiales bacterium]|nr:FecR domain-containing protein [Myxococcales bacterium]